jgi:hypothetical protein
MRDLEAMREIACTGSGLGWASWSFAPIEVSRLVVAEGSGMPGNGMEEARGAFHSAAYDETVLRSAEMTWLWE